MGLGAVLADGTVLSDMSAIRKKSGYEIKQLMIGSEGTLGIITKAAIKCPTEDPPKHLVMLAVPTFSNCVEILKHAR